MPTCGMQRKLELHSGVMQNEAQELYEHLRKLYRAET